MCRPIVRERVSKTRFHGDKFLETNTSLSDKQMFVGQTVVSLDTEVKGVFCRSNQRYITAEQNLVSRSSE
jgi:hypothetical protein